MCRRTAERGRAGRWGRHRSAPVRLALAALFLAVAAGAQGDGDAVPLRPDTQRRLASLQGEWLDWLTAAQSGEGERAALAAADLLAGVADTGLERLPELSRAAAARAVSFTQEGRAESARLGLELAESLDPGRPETAFAAATVARSRGDYVGAVVEYARGLTRIGTLPLTRYVVTSNLLTWVLLTLALAALGYIGVQMATRGQLLYRDLSQALSRSLPPALSHLLTLAILLWPALLPAGLLWVAFFWSVLLWGYGGRAERVVMIALWVFIGGLPFVVSEQARHMDLSLSRPVRAIENVAGGRLEGELFDGLQVLHDLLPESVPVHHLTADLHLRLRQWNHSQALYRRVLAAEPTATAAVTDLGIGLFYEGDFKGAVRELEDAVARPDASAEAFFILGQAYGEDLRFDEQSEMTARALELADDNIDEWMRADPSERVISVAGGFERGPEIRQELAEVWRAGQGDPSLIAPWKRMLSLPLALVFILPAIALNFLKRRSRNRSRRLDKSWWTGESDTVRRGLLPAIAEIEEGHTLRGLPGLVVLMALVALCARSLMSYTLPLGYDPRMGFLTWIGAAGLVLYFALRFRRSWLRGPSRD